MTDDLVRRLRGNHDDISHEDIYESADRIEQDAQHIDEMYALVAAVNADHTATKTRIEKLEAALLSLVQSVEMVRDNSEHNQHKKHHCVTYNLWEGLCKQTRIARKALEGKNG